jgi:mRNA-degrading endonuclease toxin of MazEF toxin-antitoxin module
MKQREIWLADLNPVKGSEQHRSASSYRNKWKCHE